MEEGLSGLEVIPSAEMISSGQSLLFGQGERKQASPENLCVLPGEKLRESPDIFPCRTGSKWGLEHVIYQRELAFSRNMNTSRCTAFSAVLTESTSSRPNVDLLLAYYLRRWPNSKTIMGECLVFSGLVCAGIAHQHESHQIRKSLVFEN